MRDSHVWYSAKGPTSFRTWCLSQLLGPKSPSQEGNNETNKMLVVTFDSRLPLSWPVHRISLQNMLLPHPQSPSFACCEPEMSINTNMVAWAIVGTRLDTVICCTRAWQKRTLQTSASTELYCSGGHWYTSCRYLPSFTGNQSEQEYHSRTPLRALASDRQIKHVTNWQIWSNCTSCNEDFNRRPNWYFSSSQLILIVIPTDTYRHPNWYFSSSQLILFVIPTDTYRHPNWYLSSSQLILIVIPTDTYRHPNWYLSSSQLTLKELTFQTVTGCRSFRYVTAKT